MERTFHPHKKSELHGITVLVETTGDELWIGRCDDEDAERVILLDADRHSGTEASADAAEAGGKTRDQWLDHAKRFGVWANHPRVVIPRQKVEKVVRLGEL